jgi:arylsulfatase A-like enzyme
MTRQSDIEPDPKKGRYITDAMGDEANDYIARQADNKKPFFLYLGFTSPHIPLQAKEQDLAQLPNLTGSRQKQAAMHLAEDRVVERIVQTLKDKGS